MLGPSSWVPAACTSCSLIAAVLFPGGAAAAKAGFLRAGRARRYLAQGTALIGGKLTGPYVTYFDRKYSLSHRRVPPPASVRRWSCCSRIWRTAMSTKIALITYIEVLFMP